MKRIFVSSTFKDMNFERDAIQQTVLPELDAIARSYGESISFCDLRWGVNTAELETDAGSQKVLSVCLDEIDNCRPYMIVLLGERYGWIPSETLISEAIENRRNLALDELEKSVTALEIEYGALSAPGQFAKTLFYFRELTGDAPTEYQKEDRYHQEKLKKLKDRIIRITQGQVKTYQVAWDSGANCLTGIDAFAQTLIRDVRAIMEKEWQSLASLSARQKDLRGQWEYARFKSSQFSARENLIAEYIRTLSETGLLAVRGPSGCGKSTLMSRLALTLKEAGHEVLPIFCGSSQLCGSTLDVVKYIVDYLENAMSVPHFADKAAAQTQKPDGKMLSTKDWCDQMDQLLCTYTLRTDRSLYILIDAADQLANDEDRNNLRFVPSCLGPRIKMVFSCLEEFPIPDRIPAAYVSPLSEGDRVQIIRGILASMGRDLDQPVLQAMIRKPGSNTPLYLSLLVHRLTMMDKEDFARINAMGGGMEQITAHQTHIVESCADDLNGLCVDILREAAKKVGGSMAFTAAKYLAVSRHGLREQDLSGLFQLLGQPWSSLDFARFLRYMGRFFFQRDDGRYDFTHKSFRMGMALQDDAIPMHRDLLAHFAGLDPMDPIRMREFVYHCILSDEYKIFSDYIEAYEFSPPIAEHAARTTAELAREDGGRWLTEVHHRAEETGAGHNLLCFFTFEMDGALSASQENLLLKRKILHAAILFAKPRAQKLRSPESWEDLAKLYTVAARNLEALGSAQDLATARIYHENTLKIRQVLDKKAGNGNSRFALAQSYAMLGSSCKAFDDPQQLHNGLAFIEQAAAIFESLEPTAEILQQLAGVHFLAGGIYLMLDGTENLRSAIARCEKAIAIWEQLLTQTSSETRELLATGYSVLGGAYYLLDPGRYAEKATELYMRSVALHEQLAAQQDTVTAKSNLAGIYSMLSSFLQNLDGRENLSKARGYTEKALPILETLADVLGTADSKKDLATAYRDLATIQLLLQTEPDHAQALALYEKALATREALAQEQNIITHRQEASFIHNRIGTLYMQRDSEGDLEKATAHMEAGLMIQKDVHLRLGTPQSKLDLSLGYKNTGNAYRAAQTPEGDQKALECYQSSLELDLQLQEENPSISSTLALAVSYDCIGSILVRSKNSNDLQRSLEYYKKALALYDRLVQDNDSLAIQSDRLDVLYRVAAHKLTPAKEEHAYIPKILSLAKDLYRRTGSEDHKYYIDACYTGLKNIWKWRLLRAGLLLAAAGILGLVLWLILSLLK